MYKEEKITQKIFLLADQLELMQFNSIQKEKEIIFVNEMIKQKRFIFHIFLIENIYSIKNKKKDFNVVLLLSHNKTAIYPCIIKVTKSLPTAAYIYHKYLNIIKRQKLNNNLKLILKFLKKYKRSYLFKNFFKSKL